MIFQTHTVQPHLNLHSWGDFWKHLRIGASCQNRVIRGLGLSVPSPWLLGRRVGLLVKSIVKSRDGINHWRNDPSIKPQKDEVQRALVNTCRCGYGMLREAWKFHRPLPTSLSYYASILSGCSWVISFYINGYSPSKMFLWVLWAAFANVWNPRRGSLQPPIYSQLSEAQVTTWTCDWHLEQGGDLIGQNPLPVNLILSLDSVRIEL